MKMIDMKVESEDKNELDAGYYNPYGYGLNLYLDDDRLEKLGYDRPLEAGKKVTIMAHGIVEEATESTNKTDGKRISMSIQIHELGIETGKPDPADVLYKKEK